MVAAGIAHARACHEAALALAAADREAAERHADRARSRRRRPSSPIASARAAPDEPPETRATRARLDQAHVHLASVPAEPYAWLEGWPPAVAGAMLRDLPEEALAAARPGMQALAAELGAGEPILALAADRGEVTAATPRRVLTADATGVRPATHPADPRVAAIAELVAAAGGGEGIAPPPAHDRDSLLRALRELREAGLLSAGEYEAKRAEVLRR